MATVTVEISEYDSLREQLKNEKEVNNSLKGEIVEYKKTIKEVETDKKESIQTISDNYNKEVKALESQARVLQLITIVKISQYKPVIKSSSNIMIILIMPISRASSQNKS